MEHAFQMKMIAMEEGVVSGYLLDLATSMMLQGTGQCRGS
tara:strand:- start:3259 stop:3378 length:120 start_codon:yes stop_codon:yes gene_type:complete